MISDNPFVEVDDEPLHKEIFRNDYVRIYRAILEPGETTCFHRHSKNTLYISLHGGSISTETLKGTPSCPAVLSKSLSLMKRIHLLFQNLFCSSLHLFSGFVFYMPSEKNPVIHRAIASSKNNSSMDLMGIEVLPSNLMKYKEKYNIGKIEIESDDIIVRRIRMNPDQKLSGNDLGGDGIIILLSGRLDIKAKGDYQSLKPGDFYLAKDEGIQEIENKGLIKIEILYVYFKM